jgi:hypothetical protein
MRFLEEIEGQDEGFCVADIFQAVPGAAVEEKGVPFIQDKSFFFNLVFDAALHNVFAFEGIGPDHLFAGGFLFQFQQDDIGSLGGNASCQDPPVGEAPHRFFGEQFLLAFPYYKDMRVIDAVVHILEESPEVFVERVDDIKKDRKGRNGTVVLDLRDESFTDTGLLGQLFQRDILLSSFRLDLVPDQQKEFFVHNSCDRLLWREDTEILMSARIGGELARSRCS